MTHRILAVLLASAVLAAPLAGQTRDGAADDSPRTPWGDPDLQGVWNYSMNTPLERPAEFGARAVLTEEEAARRAQADTQLRFAQDNRTPAVEAGPTGGDVGGYNRFWTDLRRTPRQASLVVDPPDGRIPALTQAAEEWHAETRRVRRGISVDAPTPGGFVEDLGRRGLFTRCIIGFNSGPPMIPTLYNANVQIVQTPEHVALLNEMVHSVRLVPLDARPPVSPAIRQWLGDSRGRWEGDTLVVTTTNFTDQVFDPSNGPPRRDGGDPAAPPSERIEMLGGNMRPLGRGLTLVERFTRTGEDTLLYRFTMHDPAWYAAAWTAQIPMTGSIGPVYEYACHEGNHSLVNILAGAR